MSIEQWLGQAEANAELLKDLLRAYHPINRQAGRWPDEDFITAAHAEAACTQIRREIQATFTGDPVTQFDEALAARDVQKVCRLLNEAWFGVPESTTCWRIPGFREAVDLIEDPPEIDQ